MNKNIKKIVFASAIIGINFAFKYLLQFLPNVKPTTALIILSTMYMGIGIGSFINIGIVILSGLLFGFGTFVPFQFLAWEIILIFSYIFRNIFKKNKIVFLIFTLLSAFFFGAVVSLDNLILYGFGTFLSYYLNGVIFDLFHAIGNVVFSGILFVVFANLYRQRFFKDFMI